ncbi:hypothetical protein F2Q69_00014020 [Brassica cretica]|uniref:Uncharacterized protein n=1 Tax=Brassica cretica TaxID=69181 RepID=A0A8S9R8E2_BRACR|nr:hypothetical protein F2Q69_00014020 [Brassica cretica]
MEEMKKDIARIQNATDTARPPSINRGQPQSIDSRQSPSLDRHHHASIDNCLAASIDTNPPHPHTMKSQPDFHTREEIDQLVEEIYRALESTEERFDGRCDDIYFPLDLTIGALTSKVEAIQGELVEIQSYIARRPEASLSIDRRNNKLIETNNSTSIDTDSYAALTRHQFKLESLGERLQRIENTTATMKDKWCKGDEAMRDFTGPDTCLKVLESCDRYSKIMNVLEISDDFGAFWRCLEQALEMTIEIDYRQSPSLARRHHTSIDTNPPHSHTKKSQLNFHTREELDQLVEGIYRALETTEERLDGRCDDIYFPMDLTIGALTSKVEAIQGELVEIHSYIACRLEASISIYRRNNKSIDTYNSTSIDSETNRGRLVPKTTSDMSNTPYHGKEISADT